MTVYASLLLILVTLDYVSSANRRQRCSAPTFSCQFNDPCDPLCVQGQHQYPGRGARVYVECVAGRCTEQQCPRRTTWHQARKMCTGRNGLEARCAFGKFDCDARNPCNPALCEDGVENYPGPSPRWYVTCAGGCSKVQCPRRQMWDQERQRCVRKTSSCRWQETAVSTPVVDCSNDFSFHNRQYSNVERGFLHHDGFVDCEEASGDYYVEDHNSAGLGGLISCHPSTGLCFTLTSGDNDGSTGAAVQIVNGPDPFSYPINTPLSALDHEVPASCVEMSTIARNADYPNIAAFGAACYNQGGQHVYMRGATYRGTCSDKIPCDTISSSDVTIYQFVC